MKLYYPMYNGHKWSVLEIDTDHRFRKLTPHTVDWCGMLLNADTLFTNENAVVSWINKDYATAYKSIAIV